MPKHREISVKLKITNWKSERGAKLMSIDFTTLESWNATYRGLIKSGDRFTGREKISRGRTSGLWKEKVMKIVFCGKNLHLRSYSLPSKSWIWIPCLIYHSYQRQMSISVQRESDLWRRRQYCGAGGRSGGSRRDIDFRNRI